MIRSCLKSAWKALSSPALHHSYVGVKTLSSPLFLKPTSHSLSYFSKPNLIQPVINEFLKPTTEIRLNQKCTLTKYSLKKGKRKTVRAVIKRFYRLNWGMWIRTMCGRHKKLYKKSASRKRRLRRHMFTNATQSWLLDKMVTRFWRKPKFYVDDPYEPYHRREGFPITRKKPFIPYE